eukprot:5048341-Lingulodinium_polyedra.AAC.1
MTATSPVIFLMRIGNGPDSFAPAMTLTARWQSVKRGTACRFCSMSASKARSGRDKPAAHARL